MSYEEAKPESYDLQADQDSTSELPTPALPEINEEEQASGSGGGCCGCGATAEPEVVLDDEGNPIEAIEQIKPAGSKDDVEKMQSQFSSLKKSQSGTKTKSGSLLDLGSKLSRQGSKAAEAIKSGWCGCGGGGGGDGTEQVDDSAVDKSMSQRILDNANAENVDEAATPAEAPAEELRAEGSGIMQALSKQGSKLGSKISGISQTTKKKAGGCCGCAEAEPEISAEGEVVAEPVEGEIVAAPVEGEPGVEGIPAEGADLEVAGEGAASIGERLGSQLSAAGSKIEQKGSQLAVAANNTFCCCCGDDMTADEITTEGIEAAAFEGGEGDAALQPEESALQAAAEGEAVPAPMAKSESAKEEEAAPPVPPKEETLKEKPATPPVLEATPQIEEEISQPSPAFTPEPPEAKTPVQEPAQLPPPTPIQLDKSPVFIPEPGARKPGSPPMEETNEAEDAATFGGTQAEVLEAFKAKFGDEDETTLQRWSQSTGCYLVYESSARGFFSSVWSEKPISNAIAFFNVGVGVPVPTAKVRSREKTPLSNERGSPKKVLKSAFIGFGKVCCKYDGDFRTVPSKVWASEALGSTEVVWLDPESHLMFCKKGTKPFSTKKCQAFAVVDNSFRLQGGRPRQKLKPSWTKAAFASTVRSIANSAYTELDYRQRVLKD